MVLYYILLPLAWLVFHIGFRVHTVCRENLRKVQTKGCIIAPNHVSAIDPVFLGRQPVLGQADARIC
jgi:1-acyl-sn-glycerol-3-phosphate acyltransferase